MAQLATEISLHLNILIIPTIMFLRLNCYLYLYVDEDGTHTPWTFADKIRNGYL